MPSPLLRNKVGYKKSWNARAGQVKWDFDEERRKHYTVALREHITSILEERATREQKRSYDYRLIELAKALAVIDSQGSAALVLEVIALPGEWDGWQQVDALEILLVNGVSIPLHPTLTLIDPTFERARMYGLSDQEIWLVKRYLCVLPFVEVPKLIDFLVVNYHYG
jgi:hypothetical protein